MKLGAYLKNPFAGIEPTLGPMEAEYRRAGLAAEQQLFAVGALSWACISLGFTYNDYLFHDLDEQFRILVGVRCAFAIVAVCMVTQRERFSTPKAHDWAALVVCAAAVFASFYVSLTRPPWHAVVNAPIAVVLLHLIMPGPPIFRITPSLLMTALTMYVFFACRTEVPQQVVFVGIQSFVVANLLGGLISVRFNNVSRRQFLAESTLRMSENRYRQMFENNSAVKLLIDPRTGNILDANRAASDFYGYPRDKLQQLNIADINVLPREAMENGALEARTDERIVPDFRHRLASGEIRDIEVRTGPVQTEGGVLVYSIINDITERTRAQNALRKSEETYRRIFENIEDVYFEAMLDGKTVQLSPSVERILGYARAELIGNSLLEIFVNPADGIALQEALLTRGELRDYETLMRGRDGTVRTCSTNARLIWGEDGVPIRSCGIIRDITEQKKAEQLLRAELLFRETVIDIIPLPLFVKDAVGRYTVINKAFGEFYGVTASEIMGKTVFELIPDKWAALHHEADLRLLANPGRERYEANSMRLDGAIRDVFHDKAVFFDSEGAVAGIVGVMSDITEPRLAERTIREKEQSLQRALTAAQAGTFHYDLRMNRNTCSEQAIRIFGLSRSDPHDRYEDWAERVHPEDWAVILPVLRMIFEFPDQDRFEVDYRVVRPQGDIRHVFTKAFVKRSAKGNPIEISGLVFDITERKRMESELKAAMEAAQQANEAKGRFLARMSHEIRTPINGVIGMTELALNGELSDEQRGYLQSVAVSADSLLRLIDDILDFSRIEAQKLDLEPRPFALRDMICDALTPLSVQAGVKGLELICRFAPELPDEVIGDDGRLGQVLVNLVANAIKFTEEGEISVHIRAENVNTDRFDAHFTVTDTGIGIEEQDRDRIFSPFEQVEGSSIRRYKGAGLGLTICSDLVGLMGGWIRLDPTYTSGSAFHFTVPLGIAEDFAGEAWLTVIPELNGLTALVVEENASSRAALADLLEPRGIRVVYPRETQEAFDFAVVSTDVPAQREISEIKRPTDSGGAESTPVILLSRPGVPLTPVPACYGGQFVRLFKPVRPSKFLRAVLDVVTKEGPSRSGKAVGADTALSSGNRSVSILLVEDSEVNRQVALGMLTKMGHTVTVAYDGNEALIHHLERRFDLILMDVEMPEMDGVQATAIIRAREEKGCARTPIIALTANAMRGDEERFLAAGMDGYLAKPVRGEALKGAVEKFTARCEGDPGATKESPSAESGNDVLDRDALMETVYRDPETLVTLIDLFVTNALESLDAIKAAVEAGDAKALFRGAHKLKGMSLTMQGRLAAAAALSLETMGRDEDLAGAAEAVAELESRLNHFIDALKAFSEDTRRAVIMQ